MFVVLCSALAVVSCSMELSINEPQLEEGFAVTINAGNPEAMPASKTEMEGVDTFWSVGDKIGVSNGTDSNVPFTTDIAAKSATAAFTGTLAVGDYYAYYPYTSNGVGSSGGDEKGAKVDLPANQNPTATSFDGSADILVSKQFNVAAANPTIDDLEFARLGAIVKIVLIDAEGVMTTTQCPSFVSMTAATNLAGRVLVNMKDQELGEPYYSQSKTVTANYTEETKYEIDGTNATYLVVVPQTLAAGSTLTIAASTPGYDISKEITVPAGGIELAAGKITTLKINLYSANISADAGAALPFNDNFSWQNGAGTNKLNFDSSPAIPSAKYSAQDVIYQGSASGVIRMSTSSATGYLKTIALDLSSPFYVHINSKYWSDSDATHLFVSVDDGEAQEIVLTSSYADYYLNFPAATNKSKVKLTTTASKRAYFKAFDVISGTYVMPPVINVTTDNPMGVANTASSQTIEYTIENPTEATLTAVSGDAWISNINYSTPGQVTFDVAAQESGAAARDGSITLSYEGAENVVVTVSQAAGEGAAVDYSIVYTSNVTLSTSGGTSASEAKVVIGSQYDAIKAGTSKIAGAMKLTVPTGTSKLHVHIAGWKGESVTIGVTPAGKVSSNASKAVAADSGVTSNSPFTLSGTASDYYYCIDLTGIDADTELTFTATAGKRFVIWGVNAE